MKRKLHYYKSLKQAALAVPAAALMLGASQAAQIGINFQDNYNGNAYAPLTAASAFGIPLANWFNAPSINNSYGTPVSANANFSVPGGGALNVAWSCKNTWSLYAPIPTEGDKQVIYGYLDDTDYGYTVTITGWRAFASSFTITTIATSDGATGFQDVSVFSKTETNTLQYLYNFIPDWTGNASPLSGTSTVSSAFVTLNGNDSITIRGLPKTTDVRSCLAGILINYTPSTANLPLIEANPQVPAGTLFPGSSFVLSAQASGATPLSYQWRKGGAAILGATFASYTNASAVVGDSGSYDVVVTNPNGTATSTAVQVTIQDVTTPVIAKAPISQTLYQGYSATFAVEATGGSLSYQWKKGTTTIAGATTSSYTIPSIVAADQDTYTVTISNPLGNAEASANLTVKVPAAGSYEAAVAQTKPLIWYRASETEVPVVVTGSAANSGTGGSADNGVAKKYVAFQQPGALAGDANKSAGFTGNNQMIDVAYDPALNPAVFTAEMWVKAPPVNNGLIAPLINRGPSAGDGFLFFGWNGVTTWQFRCYSGTTRSQVYSTSPIVPGAWTHLVGVFDGTTVRLYVNGVEEANVAGTYVPNSSIPLRMGGWPNDNGDVGGGNFAGGGLDEVAIYSTVLTPAEILAHYQNGTNAARTVSYDALVQASTPVGYWRLNDPVGPVAPAPRNSGTLGVTWNGAYGGDIVPATIGPRPPGQPGLESTNLAVSMTNGYVSAPLCTNLNVNTITVAGWLKPAEIASSGDLGWPCWFGDGGMHIENSGGRPARELRYHWKGGQWGWGSGLVVPADTWTFVAMVVEPTKATFYMSDGTTLKTAVNNANHAALAVTSALGFGGNQPGRADRTYIGQQDEFAVYNRALTQSEINTLFMVGMGVKLQLTLSNGGIIEDTKPSGTLHHGVNTSVSTAWVASSTDVNTPAVTRTGVAQFSNAVPSQITIAADPDFNSTVGTIMFWMRYSVPLTGLPGPGQEGAMLVDRRTGAGTVIVLNDGGNLFVQCAGGANSLTAGGYLVDDLWHHVAVTYDQSASGNVTVYIDGFNAGSQLNTAAWSWPAGQQIELGRSHDGYWKRFDGQMDDFRIYNRVLTEAEIASVKASEAIVDASALKVRYNFSTSGIGKTVSWPFGTLQSSPVLGPDANWTPVPGAVAPNYPFLPTDPQLYFRAIP